MIKWYTIPCNPKLSMLDVQIMKTWQSSFAFQIVMCGRLHNKQGL